MVKLLCLWKKSKILMAINWLENELVLCNRKDGTCKTFEFDITFRFYADTDVDSLVSPKFSAIV